MPILGRGNFFSRLYSFLKHTHLTRMDEQVHNWLLLALQKNMSYKDIFCNKTNFLGIIQLAYG